jgi:hypothetical protein
MGKSSNAIALLGLCLLAARGNANTPTISHAAHDPAALEVLVFSERVAAPPADSHAESLTLQVDIVHGPTLPPQLTIYEVRRPATRAAASVAGADERAAVVAVYSKLGPRVLAEDVAGSSPAPPEVSGKPRRHYRLVVLSKPSEGSEQAYNDWYDHQHVPDVLRVPGFTAAQRLKLIQIKPATYSLPGYAVTFEFDSYDLQATIADVRHRLTTGITKPSPAFDMKSSITRYYEVATRP